MRPPLFWSRPPESPCWQARLLAPLAGLYARATASRVARGGAVVGVPVICVGNINAGGTGKTPTVMAILQMLAAEGRNPHVISRGYGGKFRVCTRVDVRAHTADQVGDEPLLLASLAPTWIGADREESALKAIAEGADCLVMDDGFQSPALAKDLSIVVIDAHSGFGNAQVIPAGPLREPVAAGLARADLVLTVGAEHAQRGFYETWGQVISVPRIQGALVPLETGMRWSGLRALAFAGIGRPKKFFDTLAEQGAEVVATHALDDHQTLGTAMIARLEREALQLGAQMVTTEKDAVRLPPNFRNKVLVLPVRLRIDDESVLRGALSRLF